MAVKAWKFPLLSDLPLGQWPLAVLPPQPSIEGDIARVLCPTCQMPRDPRDVFDMRLAGLNVICTHCLHAMIARGETTWGDIARVLKAPAKLLTAFNATDTEAVRQGFHRPRKPKRRR